MLIAGVENEEHLLGGKVVKNSLAVPVVIESEDGMLILFGFGEERVTVRGEVVKVKLIVADVLLSTAEDFALTVVAEVGNSVSLGSVVMVANEGSMIISDSKTVGDDTIIVSEFSLELVRITEAVGETVGNSVLSEALGLIVDI